MADKNWSNVKKTKKTPHIFQITHIKGDQQRHLKLYQTFKKNQKSI